MKKLNSVRTIILAGSLLLQLSTLCFHARGAAGDVDLSFDPLPADALRGIIVGTDAPMDDVTKLLSLLKEARYAHVARYWASHHSEHYALHYSKDKKQYLEFIQKLRTEQMAKAKGHVRYGADQITILTSRKGETYEMGEGSSSSPPPVTD